jgi:hypothetical protein
MINVNVTGTVAAVITMYELMKERGYGKIVGPLVIFTLMPSTD